MVQQHLVQVKCMTLLVSGYIVLAVYSIETKKSNSYTRRNKSAINNYIEPTYNVPHNGKECGYV